MRIVRERPCQRRHHRVTAPLHVTFGCGAKYRSHDWSLGGVSIEGFEGDYPAVGDKVELLLELPFQGYDISFDVEASVIRISEDDRVIAFEFEELTERSHDLMNHFIQDLIRGKMGTIEDAICRIDVPVTPISTEPDPNPTQGTAVRRWPVKTLVMSSLYIVLGIFVFGYVGLLLYSNIMRLEVQSAVVSAPLQTVKMPVDGIVRPIRFVEGARVRKGDEIARIDNLRLAGRISDAEIKYNDVKDALWRAEQKFRVEKERLKLYQIINRTDRDIVVARIEARKEALKAADAHLQRTHALAAKGYATAAKLDEARNRQATAAAALREAELDLERASAMDAVSGRRHYNHKEFVTDLDMMSIDVSEARSRFETAAMQLHALQVMQERQVVRAPFDGRIVTLFQSGDSNVLRDEPLLVLERDSDLTITAFLNQEEILEVGLNDEAQVFLPALGRHIVARVVAIDRSSAFVDGKSDHYTWRGTSERTAAVSLKIQRESRQNQEIRAGLPAVVIFDRRLTSDIYSRISDFSVLSREEADAEAL
ncbi:HlyD family efflux transporter periplasmic adaptor subunit [Pelagibius sp. Alg239-R121]|uniref:HlyD family efflux transporter periplasmic adaptor subunit n=1 Tax=Pelagibius sp. Alg239-R121 TaxID=2993448 RepID=UPI0024A675F9|nr:HlyD family efflux transporter periplasmic adaptor subunit [Pelagibius sp. Alg239-R121]